MATETETSVAVVAIKADLSHLLKEMKKVSPEAAAMTKDLVSAVNKNLKDLEKGYDKLIKQIVDKTKDTAKKVGKSWNDIAKSMQSNQMISDLEQVGSMFMLVGGNVSKMAMIFTSSIRPLAMVSEVLTQAFGPAGPALMGLAALPLVAAGAVMAIKGLADGGLEAAAHLKELGVRVGPEQQDALKSYEHALRELDITMSRLKLSAGEQAAPAIDRLVTSLTILMNTSSDTEATLRSLGEHGQFVADVFDHFGEASGDALYWLGVLSTGGGLYMRNLAEGGLTDATDQTIALREAAYRAAEGIAKASKEAAAADAQLDGYRDWAAAATEAYVALGLMVPVVEEEREATEAARKSREALTAATRASAEAERIRGQYLQANEAILQDVAAIQKENAEAYMASFRGTYQTLDAIGQAYGELMPTLEGVSDAFEELADRAQAMRDIGFQIAGDVLTTFQTISDGIMAAAKARSDALDQAVQDDRDRISELRQEYRDYVEEHEDADKKYIERAHAWTQDEVARVQERIDARQTEMAEQKKAAEVAYALSQSFAVSQAMISAAQMAIGMAAQLSTFSGVAAVPIAIAASGAMLATQLAAIAAAPPPEFPMGGMVSTDHKMVATRGDEGILNPRGLRNIGGEQGLDHLNGGGEIGGGDGPETVALLRRIADQLTPPRGPGVQRAVRGRRT